MSQHETIALVTGASRGAGNGIAVALGQHGCTVYVTGRSQQVGDHALPGTIFETAQAVTDAGGRGIAVRCDHSDDADVAISSSTTPPPSTTSSTSPASSGKSRSSCPA
jgi:NAD(P)-dependent dehydrogenase (short-subunit alcohol dehydrogenase family)